MIDVEPLIRDQLDRAVPMPSPDRADWQDVRRRAGRRPGAGRTLTRGRVGALTLAALILGAVAATPVGGAIASQVGDFSRWLTGSPGTPAPTSEQRAFERAHERPWTDFPERPELRELLRAHVGATRYVLYGFRSGNAICLRLSLRWSGRVGSSLSCVARKELERSRDLVVPVKANDGLGHVGPLPRDADDPPTVPRAIASYGFLADRVRDVRLVSDRRTTPALTANGSFLHVLSRPARGEWVRAAIASDDRGRRQRLPLLVMVSGQPPLTRALRARGPATVEREVRGGTIGWFVRRERRGESLDPELRRMLSERPRLRIGQFARVIRPDPRDFLRVVVAERAGRPGELCAFSLPGGGGTCGALAPSFSQGPLRLSWGFSGAGQQFWIVEGLASDDVYRVEAFLATGERRPLALADNVVVGRIPAVKLPARIVGYDAQGRVISVTRIQGPAGKQRAKPIVSTFRTLIRARAENGTVAVLRVARSTAGGECLEVRMGNGLAAGCHGKRWRGPPVQLGAQGRGRAWFLYGRVQPQVALLEIVYRDGDVTTTKAVDGYVLYAVPARHAREGHRVTVVVARDASGKVIGRQDFQKR